MANAQRVYKEEYTIPQFRPMLQLEYRTGRVSGIGGAGHSTWDSAVAYIHWEAEQSGAVVTRASIVRDMISVTKTVDLEKGGIKFTTSIVHQVEEVHLDPKNLVVVS